VSVSRDVGERRARDQHDHTPDHDGIDGGHGSPFTRVTDVATAHEGSRWGELFD
jgi:hypothetical protein